jgi:LemA protein
MAGAIVLAVLAALGAVILSVGAVGLYNSLVQVRHNVDKAFANIDVLLQQRHDELPKLIDTCLAYMNHERGTLNELTALRAGYDRAPSVQEKIRIENEINRDLNQLRTVWEGYPDLKASQGFLQIQGRVSALESSIADRREFFNDSVTIYNIQIAQIPHFLVARLLGYRKHSFLEIPDDLKQDVKMDFARS